MTTVKNIDDKLSQMLAANNVEVLTPRESMLQLNSVELGPRHNKPRTNLLLCRTASMPAWDVFVDEDLRYIGDDQRRRRLFGQNSRERWQQLHPVEPIVGDVNQAILRALRLLDSPMQLLASAAFDDTAAGDTIAEDELDPILAQTGRLLEIEDLKTMSVAPTRAQDEAATRAAAVVTRGVAPRCPLILGESGSGKTAVAVLAAERMLQRGTVQRVLEISGAAISSGAIFKPQRDDRLRLVLEAVRSMSETLVLMEEFDLAIGVSETAASLISLWLDRGAKFIGIARAEFSPSQIEEQWTLRRRLEPVPVEEPDADELEAILAGHLANHPLGGEVEVAPEVISAVIMLSTRREGANPGAAMGLLEAAISQAAWTGSALAGPDDLYHLISQNEE